MIRISVNQPAFEGTRALPFGSAVFDREPDVNGEYQIWLARAVVDWLKAMRAPSESYSDVILQLVEIEASRAAE